MLCRLTVWGFGALIALTLPTIAIAQSGPIPAWLHRHVGYEDGKIAPIVLTRARALHQDKLRRGKVRNPCYLAMDATRPSPGPGGAPALPSADEGVAVVVGGYICDVVERDSIVVVIVQHIIIRNVGVIIIIVINVDVVVEYQIFFFLSLFGFGCSFVGDQALGAALAGFKHYDFAGVRADNWAGAQIVEPFSGCRTDALYAPFLIRHDSPFNHRYRGKLRSAIVAEDCQSLSGITHRLARLAPISEHVFGCSIAGIDPYPAR